MEKLESTLKQADASYKINRAKAQALRTKQLENSSDQNDYLDEKAIKNIDELKHRGRPSKYEKKYCNMLVDHCARGGHMNDFCTQIGVSQSTVYLWASARNDDGTYKYPDFVEAKKTAEAFAHRYWSEVGRRGIIGNIKGFNAAAWIFLMKNKFQWTDRHDVTTEIGNIGTDDNILRVEFVSAKNSTT